MKWKRVWIIDYLLIHRFQTALLVQCSFFFFAKFNSMWSECKAGIGKEKNGCNFHYRDTSTTCDNVSCVFCFLKLLLQASFYLHSLPVIIPGCGFHLSLIPIILENIWAEKSQQGNDKKVFELIFSYNKKKEKRNQENVVGIRTQKAKAIAEKLISNWFSFIKCCCWWRGNDKSFFMYHIDFHIFCSHLLSFHFLFGGFTSDVRRSLPLFSS